MVEWKDSYQDFLASKIPSKEEVSYYCVDCGKEVISQVVSIKSFHSKVLRGKKDPCQDDFLCKSCKIKRLYQKKYGVDNPQQLENVKILNKETFYKNHPDLIPYSEEPYEYEGSLEDLIKKPLQSNRKVRFKCTRCGKITDVNFGTLRERHKKWTKENKDLSKLLCRGCTRACAVHPDMIPLQDEPILWGGSLEDLKKIPCYLQQKIRFICRDCGKEVVMTFGALKYREKKDLLCASCNSKSTSIKRYGVPFPSTKDIPDQTKEILLCKDKLKKFIDDNREFNGNYLSENILHISPITLKRYTDKYGIEFPVNSRSKPESEVNELLSSWDIKYLKNCKSIIAPYELDIYIPDKRIAIEFNGNYWHSSSQVSSRSLSDNDGKYYHQNKSKLCQEKGIRLIHIFEYEWDNNKEKIISYLKDILLPCIRIGARLCKVKEISFKESEAFENLYHLQGSARSKVRVGLFYNNELISEMTFGKSRFRKDCEWELIRYVCKEGYEIIGGASKLYKYFIKSYKPSSVISYCNYGKFEGALYEKLGFEFIGLTEPGYVWVKNKEVLSRSQCQKHKLNEYEGNTEKEKMIGRGFMKIYDAGNLVYIQK